MRPTVFKERRQLIFTSRDQRAGPWFAAQTLQQGGKRSTQADHSPCPSTCAAGLRVEQGTTAQGNDRGTHTQQIVQSLFLELAKTCFTFTRKEVRN